MGIANGTTKHFRRAMKFYELSFSTIENVLQDLDYVDSNLVLLLCGLHNNMGHMYAFCNDTEESQFCLEWIQRTVVAEEFNECEVICEEDCSFFSQYRMFCSPKEQFRSAPAA